MDSIGAYYKRFCDRHIHDPLFDCCCEVIDDTNNATIVTNNGDREREGRLSNSNTNNDNNEVTVTDEMMDNFSNLSLNDSIDLSSDSMRHTSKKKRRKKSASETGGFRKRSDSSLSKKSFDSNSMKGTKHKYFSTSDLSSSVFAKNRSNRKKYNGVHIKTMNLNHQFVSLKNHMDTLSSSIPDLSKKKFAQISDHDKKILSRMVMKRRKELAMIEDAKLARQYWEEEKIARQRFIQEQNESYFKTIKEKREHEAVKTRQRIEQLEMEERAHIERLKRELFEKEAKTESLLKTLEFRKEMKMYQKRQRELQKVDNNLVHQHEHEVNDTIWRQILIERLQQRINRADNLRQKIMDVYKYRIQTDNQLQQTMHAANFDEAKKVEEFRMQQLREKIQYRDQKYKEFAEHRSRQIEESQQKAKISAAMRELIKRSISPENAFRTVQGKPVCTKLERPVSNLSHFLKIEQLEMEERAHIERLKRELFEKEAKTESLLKTLEFRKEMKMYQKRQRELQKVDNNLVHQHEHEVNDTIWRQILIERLQQRINRADNLRQKIMDVYKYRIQTDNQLQQTMHAANFDEAKKVEEFRMQQLREKIQYRDQKYKEFAEHRSRQIEESQQKAKISAAMRELIKRSISPENAFRTVQGKPVCTKLERPVSNLSHCDSHIVLG
uniref:CSON008002 protein n=1 Tax=Culicoides sonorensis TaxID=179676 RepID=A0A336MVK8_CULSO